MTLPWGITKINKCTDLRCNPHCQTLCSWPRVTCLPVDAPSGCVTLNRGGMTLDDRKPSWITDEPLARLRQVVQRVATHYQPHDIKRKQKSRQNEGTDKTKVRQNENTDHCCLSSGTPQCFWGYCSQPQTENTDTKRTSAFSHLAAEAFKRRKLRTHSARRWGTTWRLWFYNRWDRAFVSESCLVPLQGETVSTKQACFHDTECLARSTPHLLFLCFIALSNFQQPNKKGNDHVRQHLIWAKLWAAENWPHVTRMGYIRSTRIPNKNKAQPAHGISIRNKSWPNFTKDSDKLSMYTLLFQTFVVWEEKHTVLNGQLSEIGQSKL